MIADRLDALFDELLFWDDRLCGELERGRELRDLRQRVMAELRRELSRVTDLLIAAYGAATVWRIAWVLPPPQQSEALQRLAKRLHGALSDPSLELPPARHGMEIDTAELAAVFAAPMGRLGEILDQLAANESAVAHSRSMKKEAQERLGSYAQRVERFLVALSDLGGGDRMAERLRRASGV